MPVVTYNPDKDLLRIQFSSDGVDESIEVLDCVVIDFDALDKIVGIDIHKATENAILDGHVGDQAVLVDTSEPPEELFTVRELSARLRISTRTLQLTIQRMREQGQEIGLKEGVNTRTTILSESDAEQIRQWRRRHKPGRPRS